MTCGFLTLIQVMKFKPTILRRKKSEIALMLMVRAVNLIVELFK